MMPVIDSRTPMATRSSVITHISIVKGNSGILVVKTHGGGTLCQPITDPASKQRKNNAKDNGEIAFFS